MNEPPLNLLPDVGLLIGDRRIRVATGGAHEHVYPGAASPTARVPLASAQEMDEAVRAARQALPGWRAMPPNRRRDLMLELGRLIAADRVKLGHLQTIESGVPRQFASSFPDGVADYFFYNAGWIDKIGGEVVATWPAPALDYTLEEPYGVVAIIIPWNSALMSLGQLLASALAAGNTVVVKPSELAPFTSLRIGELVLEAGFPPGIVNVTPSSADGGAALARHPGVDKIHFTGSGATGRKVLASALENLTPVSLELGGKSALLVFADADVAAAAQHAVGASVVLSGQGCANSTRVLVHAAVYEKMITLMKGFMRRIRIGDPFDQGTQMGPVITAAACDRILGVIERASKNHEGRLVIGGQRLTGELGAGYFIAPTLFSDVEPASALAQEEIFGPVVSLMRFDSENDAIELANSTTYGLAGYAYTNDLTRAHRLGKEILAGNIWINGWEAISPSMPFGGVKRSGYGRVGGREGLREFMRPKNVWISMRNRAD
jgi:aldehyde dehydrogenase (NAD+)